MPKWFRQTLVVLVSILTFGMVSPSQVFPYDDVSKDLPSNNDSYESKMVQEEISSQTENSSETAALSERDQFVDNMIKEAENQSYMKFGQKIKPVIADEFRSVVLPNIELALTSIAMQFPEEDLRNLSITEMPSGGTSEKIFHIVNMKNNQDIIRFHVRRDHPPQEGYWFNFHYHTYHDQYQTHHELGSIYWDTNHPPKWMS